MSDHFERVSIIESIRNFVRLFDNRARFLKINVEVGRHILSYLSIWTFFLPFFIMLIVKTFFMLSGQAGREKTESDKKIFGFSLTF
jgi:hypothetical protein